MTLKHGIQLLGLQHNKICSNGDPGLTLTFFMQGQICSLMLFVWESAQTLDFIETIEVSEVKVRTNS